MILIISIKLTPESTVNRLKTSFKIEKTLANTSNGLRIEIWKIAIKRFQDKPIFGYGTGFDKNDSFGKVVETLPENTKVEKYYKRELRNFNDAHSMYLNALTDNGLFIGALLIIWFIIPGYAAIKNFKKQNNNPYFFAAIGGGIVYLIVGAFWQIWRQPDQLYFWILFTMLIACCNFKEEVS